MRAPFSFSRARNGKASWSISRAMPRNLRAGPILQAYLWSLSWFQSACKQP